MTNDFSICHLLNNFNRHLCQTRELHSLLQLVIQVSILVGWHARVGNAVFFLPDYDIWFKLEIDTTKMDLNELNGVPGENGDQKVLHYLEKQQQEEKSVENLGSKNEISEIFSRSDAWIKSILAGIVDSIGGKDKCEEEYEKLVQEHQHHDLFDLSQIIENFCIGM